MSRPLAYSGLVAASTTCSAAASVVRNQRPSQSRPSSKGSKNGSTSIKMMEPNCKLSRLWWECMLISLVAWRIYKDAVWIPTLNRCSVMILNFIFLNCAHSTSRVTWIRKIYRICSMSSFLVLGPTFTLAIAFGSFSTRLCSKSFLRRFMMYLKKFFQV